MTTPPVGKTALIDDSDIDLFIQRRFLEVCNFSNHLLSYQSAAEALTWLQHVTENEAPDVIFLDLNMPDLDGFGFLERFHELPEEIRKKSKIVILTSSNNQNDRKQAGTFAEVVHFIIKPMKRQDIEDIKKILQNGSSV